MQKWHYDTDAKLKRGHFIVTKLIPTLSFNNASKPPSRLLFTRGRNIHNADGFRRRKQFRNVPTACTPLLPAHIVSSQIQDFYLLWWEPESETFACLTDSHPVGWLFSLSLFRCKCQTVIFRVNQTDEQKCHSAHPPTLHFDMSDRAGVESRLRHFGSSIQQAAKRNLSFKPLLVPLVWLMWQLASFSHLSLHHHVTMKTIWQPNLGRHTVAERLPSKHVSACVSNTGGDFIMISTTDRALELMQTSLRWGSSLDGCRYPPVCRGALERSPRCCKLKWTSLLFSSAH